MQLLKTGTIPDDGIANMLFGAKSGTIGEVATLLIIGGLNWLSVGLFTFDLVAFACGGSASLISRAVYTLVGLSAVWCITLLFRKGQRIDGE